jgi:hypothetical protein
MEALKRYRTGGEQKVTVQHVTVSLFVDDWHRSGLCVRGIAMKQQTRSPPLRVNLG